MNMDKELESQAKWARRTIRYTIVSVAGITAVLAAASLEILIFKGALVVLLVFGFIPAMIRLEAKEEVAAYLEGISTPNTSRRAGPYSRLIGILGTIACVSILVLMS